jgi:ribosomal protein S18 acetylase RimI-like enzyme
MLSIRPGKPDDASKISELLICLSNEFIVGEFTETGRSYFLSQLAEEKIAEKLSGNFRFYLAEDETTLAGVAAIRENFHLFYLFVAKSHQRMGIARQLWTKVQEDCLALGNPGFFTVNASNYAVKAYERFGFVKTGDAQVMNGVVYTPMELAIDTSPRAVPLL